MILLKNLVTNKIRGEFQATVTAVQEDLNNAELASNFDDYFTFVYDRGDWTPQDPILDNHGHPRTFTDGVDETGQPNVRTIYPVVIIITDATNGKWQKTADLDAYSMIYNFEVIADDYDYDDIMLILGTHSDLYNQYRDATSFSADNYTCIMSYDVPSFGNIQNAYSRLMFSSFMQFHMLFIKNGMMGNDIELTMEIETEDGDLPVPFLTFSLTKNKIGDANTFQGEKIAKMLNNQQTLTFNIGLLYTNSTLTRHILSDIFDDDYLTSIYVLKYSDGSLNKTYRVYLVDGSMTANVGEFITLSTSWVLAKELT